MRNCLAFALTLGAFGSAFAQNAALNWERTETAAVRENIAYTKAAALPGGDFLIGGTVRTSEYGYLAATSRIVIERIHSDGTVVWNQRYPSDVNQYMQLDDWKILANGYVYACGSGSNGFDSKISLADGSQANELLIPERTLTSAISPNYMTFFAEDSYSNWQSQHVHNSSRIHTTQVLTADSAWNIVRQSVVQTEVENHDGATTRSNVSNYLTPVILFAKNGTHVLYPGYKPFYSNYNGGEQGIAYLDFKYDTLGALTWKAQGGTDPGYDYFHPQQNFDVLAHLGLDPNDSVQILFSRYLGSAQPTPMGVALDTNGNTATANLQADLAQNEILNSGAEYRSVTNSMVGHNQWEKRTTNGTTLLVYPAQGSVVNRIPSEIVAEILTSGKSFETVITPDNNGSRSYFTFQPAPKGAFLDTAISSDTGEIIIVGRNDFAPNFYGGWVAKLSQNAIANSESYSVPASALYTSSNSVLLNDRFAVGLTPKVITTTHHGSLYMNADGTFKYLPDHGFTGTDVFYYSIQRPNFPPSTAEVALTVH